MEDIRSNRQERTIFMKTALVCIAKDEDNYLREWLDYHFKIGFDDAYVYCNNWQPHIAVPNNTHLIDFPGMC